MSPKAKLAALLALAESARQIVGNATEEISSSIDGISRIGEAATTQEACNAIVGGLLPLEQIAADLVTLVNAAKVMNKQRPLAVRS